jgi:hypothetical protein
MIQSITTTYAGTKFRSRAEARWAIFFDAIGLNWQYEFDGFVVRAGAYLPDFWLPEIKMFFEVKGVEPTDEERAKCVQLAQASEYDMLLAIGNPEERFQILWFDRDGQREALYVWARDYHSACGFWLVAEDTGNWIGPDKTKGVITRAGPMLSGALEHAYEAARSARFERGQARIGRQPVIRETDGARA